MKTKAFIVHPKTNEQIDALKAFMKALNIKFEVSDSNNYNPEFVKKVLESRQEAKEGKTVRVEEKDLSTFLGL